MSNELTNMLTKTLDQIEALEDERRVTMGGFRDTLKELKSNVKRYKKGLIHNCETYADLEELEK